MRFRIGLVTLAALLSLTACQTAPNGTKMSADQLRATMPNTTAASTDNKWITYNGLTKRHRDF
jgi:hypothetical protein